MKTIEITPLKQSRDLAAVKGYLELRRTALADKLVAEAERVEDLARHGASVNDAIKAVFKIANELNTIEYNITQLR